LTAGAVLLVLIGIFVGLLAGEWAKARQPDLSMTSERSSLPTRKDGKLWRKTFPDPLFAADTPERKLATKSAWFGDLDGDGRVELLYIYGPDRAASRGASLYCFSDTGQVKWLFVPGGVVQTRAALSLRLSSPRPLRFLQRGRIEREGWWYRAQTLLATRPKWRCLRAMARARRVLHSAACQVSM